MTDQWITKSLGEIVEFQRGLTYSKADEVDSSSNIVLRANNIDLASNLLDLTELRHITDRIKVPVSKKLKRGSLLICTASGSKSHLGKVALVDDDYDYAFGGFMGQLTAKPAVDSKYLFYFMISDAYRGHIRALSDGVNINNLRFDDLKPLEVPLPPLPEQQRIVAILDEAFAGLATASANAEKNLKNARELFDSHLQFAFDANQEQIRLCELATEITDGDHSPPPKAASGVPFITISNIIKETGDIDFSDTFFVPDDYFQKLKQNKKPVVGDILYTVTGATLGIPALVKQKKDFCFQRHIGLIRPKGDVDSAWLAHALASPHSYRQATIGSTGAAQKTVSLAVLRNIEIPKLKLAKQQEVAKGLDALAERTRQLAANYRLKIESLMSLRQSILQKAFSGELTSPPSQAIKEAAE